MRSVNSHRSCGCDALPQPVINVPLHVRDGGQQNLLCGQILSARLHLISFLLAIPVAAREFLPLRW